MDDEYNKLKSVLRALVVSSPTQMDVRTLLRDYRNMMGAPVPLAKYGHRDPVAFLKERFNDCFVFGDPPSNPVLTLIVPETLKHIDQFVQRQKVPATSKYKSKRRSIPEAKANPPKENLVFKTFVKYTPPIIDEPKKPETKPPDIIYNKENVKNHKNSDMGTTDAVKNFLKKRLPLYNSLHNLEEVHSEKNGTTMSVSHDDDSGKHTSSSTSNSTKALQFEELKSEIMELIAEGPDGVWCTDLIRQYRERYKRELNFTRFGYTSIISLVYALEELVQITRPLDTGDWRLQERRRAAPAPAALRVPRPARAAPPRPAPPRPEPRAPRAPADPDDALPGIDFDPDVFPEDCLHFMESIPSMSLADFRPGAMLEVIVGEVYSPSHFWIIRLGENYNIAMEDMMDEMTRYYNGAGRARSLARGAIRVGHYCSSLYENDWHRSLIVKIVDSDTVKVRHIDYGTVDTVSCCSLRPLRRSWGALAAQAVRARLAGLRPSAAGRRWPHAAAAHFLRAVRDTRLVANVVSVDTEEDVIETLLINTAGAEDLCVSSEMIRAGHADPRADSALRTAECYLYPRFDALEGGHTPNYAELHAYLRDGIALDYVEAYRAHVPPGLPPAAPPPAPAPAAPPPAPAPADLATRIPLLWPSASPPAHTASSSNSEPSITNSEASSCPRAVLSPSPATSPTPATSPRPQSPLPPAPPPRPAPPAPRAPPPPGRTGTAGRCPAPDAPHAYPRPVRRSPAPFHPPVMFPVPQMFGPPPCAHPAGQWFGPYPAPGMVALSIAECETYRMLARDNPAAAHWFMAGALGRAMGPPGVGPGRAMGPPGPPAPGGPMRPPPGFGG